jgi:hypothetical protein
MARLLYFALASVDGFIEDADGDFSWAAPDEQVHAFVNDLVRAFPAPPRHGPRLRRASEPPAPSGVTAASQRVTAPRAGPAGTTP